MTEAITETNFELPGQVGPVYHGKVADTYNIGRDDGDLIVVVRTDRVSAYNVALPQPVPHKGQVLNQMSARLLEATRDQVPNWHIEEADPNVSIGLKAEPILVEMIVRGALLGGAWKKYSGEGMRDLCGNHLPDNMREFQFFRNPLVTPTTKDKDDTNITPQEIVESGLATWDEYDEMDHLSRKLFNIGVELADEKGLLLGDTKIEFGRLATGEIVVIDEALTPDASRYYPRDEYHAYVVGQTAERPKEQSKEFVREWLKSHGFTGKEGEPIPVMPDEFIEEVSFRYIELYQDILGKVFHPAPVGPDTLADIELNIVDRLEQI